MISSKTLSALSLLLALAACQQQASDTAAAPADNAARGSTETLAPAPLPATTPGSADEAPLPAPAPSATGKQAAASAPTTSQLTGGAERTETGARAVLLDFARAIELKRFDQAYALLSTADKRRWSQADFAAIFKDLGKLTVAVPNGSMEGAAGSSFYTAPVTITSTDKAGRPIRIEGEAVLRRVNDVPGATPDQLRWHMEKLMLDWTH